ncbi:MAG: hypothetical protein MUF83_11245 [Acidimicrobiales bacterium]|jgi:hypothetical protein|nr:hypothetical protein [Acidimicrobiales bacterium]
MRSPARSTSLADAASAGWLAIVLALATFVYYRVFLYRLDYPAHLLAGGALMFMLLAVTTVARLEPAIAATVSLAGVVVLALVGEVTTFGESTDAIDIGNSVLGALVVAASVASAPNRRAPAWLLAALGLVGLWGAWYVRYHLRYGGLW